MNPDFTPEHEQRPMFNANSAIIGVCTVVIVGVLGWVGSTTQNTASSVTEIKTTLPYMTESIKELKSQVGGMVTRSELDSRMRQSDEQNRALVKEIMAHK